MFKVFKIFIFLICLSTQAWALEELIKNYRGIRSLGMGGVVTTTGIYDEALFGNPAMQLEDPTWKLSFFSITAELNRNIMSDLSKIKSVAGASGSDVIKKIADSDIAGRNEHGRLTMIVPGFYSPRFFSDDTSFAFGLLLNTQTNVILRSNADVDALALVDIGPNFGVAHRFLNGHLNVGINVHAIYRMAGDPSLNALSFLGGQKLSLSDIAGQGVGLDGDLGVLYKLPKYPLFFKGISVGASLNNVARSSYDFAGQELLKKIKGTPPNNDRVLNTGVRLNMPDALILTDNIIAVEWQDIGTTRRQASFWKKFHAGAETHLTRRIALRGGINQGYFGGGLGFDLPLLKLDLAYYGEELGSNAGQLEDRRLALRLALEI